MPTLRAPDQQMRPRQWVEDFTPGYMRRDVHRFPKQGREQWQKTQDYAADKRMLRKPIDADGVLKITILGK